MRRADRHARERGCSDLDLDALVLVVAERHAVLRLDASVPSRPVARRCRPSRPRRASRDRSSTCLLPRPCGGSPSPRSDSASSRRSVVPGDSAAPVAYATRCSSASSTSDRRRCTWCGTSRSRCRCPSSSRCSARVRRGSLPRTRPAHESTDDCGGRAHANHRKHASMVRTARCVAPLGGLTRLQSQGEGR
mgnify:CR=1 FL=1